MTDAGGTTAGQHAYTLARAEVFIGRLGNGDELAIVELDGDFEPGLTGGAFLYGTACQSAGDGTDDGAHRGATTAAHMTTGNTADGAAGKTADRRLGTFDLHLTHAFDYAHTHRHFTARLIATVGRIGKTARTGGQTQCGDKSE